MSFPADLHSIASVASERLLFSLGMGTLLAMIVWLLLQVFPKKDSRTSFAVWFVTLLITAVLPVFSLFFSYAGRESGRTAAVITISAGWAVYIFIAWASIAGVGLARIAVALWQVRRLRSEAAALELKTLSSELSACVDEFRRSRAVALLVSKRLEVPTAIGFFKPAIVLPEWLLKETPAEELKYIILHEFAHLRRRDDWTNLAQQIVKALLFFVPSVWWIERKLALDREMACDDAVLAHSGTPRGYAECLAHVAERSFLRRQLALAQAAVTRLQQLTVRVAKILDPNRPQPARMWKPAVPAVVVVAGLCVFSVSQAPQLIGFADDGPVVRSSASGVAAGSLAPSSAATKTLQQTDADAPKLVPANLKLNSEGQDGRQVGAWGAGLKQHKARSSKRTIHALDNLRVANKIASAQIVLAGLESPQTPEYVMVREQFVMIVMQGDGAAQPQSWQVHVVEINVMQSKPQKQVPNKI